ncbi:MAG TPA: TetR/AcrR family transcriptional regulator [Solirubrobacterales bacterium]|jgi:AcrR family transcriptional regulator
MPAVEGGEEKLRRLPPGRHGLSREFVTRNQQERLIAGTIAAVAERGYRDASIGHITAAAGVSRQTFYDYFSTKEECFLAGYDLFESHTVAALGEAGAEGRGWTAKVTARVDALLEILTVNPDLARFSLAAPPTAGEELLGRDREFVERLLRAITSEAPRSTPRQPSEVELEAVAGGLASLLVVFAEESGDLDRGNLRLELLELVLAPFLGRERASTVARNG